MIIRRLTMHNFGVYQGDNTFDFKCKKPIVLVGGMNGRGKTTFLEAILLSLYGSNSIAYKESKIKSYNQYLRSYVNKNDFSQSTLVEMEFTMNESTNDNYLVRREWDALSKITKEKITVEQNGEYSEFLTDNWPMFIENILPSALSSFYFFDGEKIAELAVDNTNEQMKESIRSMLGITVLDILKNDLRRNLNKNNKKITLQHSDVELEKLRKAKDEASIKIEKFEEKILKIEKKVIEAETTLAEYHRQYEVKGGDVLEHRKELMQHRARIQTEIQRNSEMLILRASSCLPLKMVKDLIMQIKLQAEDEHDEFIMQEAIQQLGFLLEDFGIEHKEAYSAGKEFVEYVKMNTYENATEKIYEISDHSLFQINDLLEKELEKEVSLTKECIRMKKELEKELNKYDSYLSLDINEKELNAIFNKIKVQEQKVVELKVKQSELEQKRDEAQSICNSKTMIFNRAVEEYLHNVELNDECKRMAKYINMALKVTDAFTIELQKRKTDVLGETITECYSKLANKKNLINRIVMNPETLNMQYLNSEGKEVEKDSLSAGEKQLMVIAILWALALCSKKKLPVIIDTPLSRLDSQHRRSVIMTYFPNASDQTIILSTDTEIDHNYYDMIKEYVDDEFTLVYNEETKSTTIQKGYFQ